MGYKALWRSLLLSLSSWEGFLYACGRHDRERLDRSFRRGVCHPVPESEADDGYHHIVERDAGQLLCWYVYSLEGGAGRGRGGGRVHGWGWLGGVRCGALRFFVFPKKSDRMQRLWTSILFFYLFSMYTPEWWAIYIAWASLCVAIFAIYRTYKIERVSNVVEINVEAYDFHDVVILNLSLKRIVYLDRLVYHWHEDQPYLLKDLIVGVNKEVKITIRNPDNCSRFSIFLSDDIGRKFRKDVSDQGVNWRIYSCSKIVRIS